MYLFDSYVLPAIAFVRSQLTEIAPTVDNNVTESLLRILGERFIVSYRAVLLCNVLIFSMLCVCILLRLLLLILTYCSVQNKVFLSLPPLLCNSLFIHLPTPFSSSFLPTSCPPHTPLTPLTLSPPPLLQIVTSSRTCPWRVDQCRVRGVSRTLLHV
jgi:hypothetical protein